MKSFISLLSFIIICISSFAQNDNPTAPDQTNKGSLSATIADLSLKPLRLPSLQDIGGSPFFHAEYKTGTVTLADGRVVSNVSVKFNIFNGVIMIQQEGQELKLESFDMVSYDETGNDGATKHFRFKQGYPETDNRPGTAIYQVLAIGPNVHLLKFLSQKVEDAPTLGDYSRREIVTSQQLYIYVPGGEMKKVKAGKQGIADALSSMSTKIEEIVKSKSLNLKSESDIIILVEELNK
ncbi:MAG: hypothetical protein HZB42_06275 [Sphingobacteriales bacterium]|nr:hypothetical protein [Sphingobacteriales bacterium]